MDTLTHSLFGAVLSDGFFRRRLGPAATPFALVMAALPDVDSFTYAVSVEAAWANHRGYTHSFLPMAVAALILGYAGYRLSGKKSSWGWWTLLAVLCLFSHTLLDLATSWGTMPFLPFSNARLSWDIAPIVDVFILSLTAASFIANRLLRRERVDRFVNPLAYPVVHRHPRRRRIGDWTGRAALALAVLYLLVGWQQNRQTVRLAREELEKRGVTPVEVRALPVMFTYIAWGIAARDAEGTVHNAAHSSYAPGPMRFLSFPSLPKEDIASILATPEGGMFAWYSQDMYVAERVTEARGGEMTRLADRRFFMLTRPEVPRFETLFEEDTPARVPVDTPDRAFSDAPGRAVFAGTEWRGGGGIDLREEFRRLWELMWDGRGLDAGVIVDTPGAAKVE